MSASGEPARAEPGADVSSVRGGSGQGQAVPERGCEWSADYFLNFLLPCPALPCAALPCRSHLQATYDSADTQEDLALLRQQAESDAASGLTVPGIPGSEAGQEAVVAAAVANCEAQMAGDRKTTALKSLQVLGGCGWGRVEAGQRKEACTALASQAAAAHGVQHNPLGCHPRHFFCRRRGTSGRAASHAASCAASCLPTCLTPWRSGAPPA